MRKESHTWVATLTMILHIGYGTWYIFPQIRFRQLLIGALRLSLVSLDVLLLQSRTYNSFQSRISGLTFRDRAKVQFDRIHSAELRMTLNRALNAHSGIVFWVSLIFFFFFFFMSLGQWPLGPNTILLHVARSCDSRTASHSISSVHSVMLSIHLFGGLPLCRTPPTEPSTIIFISQSSSMRQICPKSSSFVRRQNRFCPVQCPISVCWLHLTFFLANLFLAYSRSSPFHRLCQYFVFIRDYVHKFHRYVLHKADLNLTTSNDERRVFFTKYNGT